MQSTQALLLIDTDFPAIHRREFKILQVNLGYLCNMSCVHCHVNAGPSRKELMDLKTINQVLDVIAAQKIETLDLTGGAPEMNPHFKYLVSEARKRDVEVIDRCNLTILLEPGYQDMECFLAEHQVTITASLPCYEEGNVEKQRGKGVYQQSIRVLQKLNELGYGHDKNLVLNLVFNPVGATLPAAQTELEAEYKRELGEKFGIVFNQLFTITNMPINRFGAVLLAQKQYEPYIQLLKNNFYEANLDTVMCRSTVSVDWRGYIYDCDFNQMLDLPIYSKGVGNNSGLHLTDMLQTDVSNFPIAVAEHCYGCTAGQGSSCSGALDA